MLAKVIPNRSWADNGANVFRYRVEYASRTASAMLMLNLIGGCEDASTQMAFTADLNPKVRAPCSHIVLCFHETEQPSDEDVLAAAQMVLTEIGASEYQAILLIHRNTNSTHVHIILNRVHPFTGASLSLSNDYARLERACRQTEHRFGWPADRGRFDIALVNGKIELCPKPQEHWDRKTQERAQGLRPDGKAVREHHRLTNQGYLRNDLTANLRDFACKILKTALHWRSVHSGLKNAGLEYVPIGSGARIREIKSQRFMPANQLGSAFSFGAMCKRLGAFIPRRSVPAETAQEAQFGYREQINNLKRSHWRARTAVRLTLKGTRSFAAQGLRAAMRETHRNAIKALKEYLSATRPQRTPTPEPTPLERYRLVLRTRQSGLASRDDHTARRQDWIVAPSIKDPYAPQIIKTAVALHQNTLRLDGNNGLLFARWDAKGRIVGFDRMLLEANPRASIQETSTGGVCMIGPQPADTCLLVRTPFEAITSLLQVGGPTPMIVIVGNALSKARTAHINWLTKGRKIMIDDDSFADRPDLKQKLKKMFPNARFLTENNDQKIVTPEPQMSEKTDEHSSEGLKSS
ncbi:relaxase/mobilization nuclease domain-containing protein [uncultured Sulfitobacter sp.]|uniref:relaxase/mobilization nuclease domain-containing protein n=1 Tax=uncultured Sulfitobacter sp. TaxID=191468 RepID=UPI002618035E|nr:relaxase/mobilization nuclease domain-containing protein [uncultured Sulfitobacter sp.]